MVLFDMWIPVIVIHIIGWNVKSLNMIFLALAICSVMVCFINTKFTLPNQFIGAMFTCWCSQLVLDGSWCSDNVI